MTASQTAIIIPARYASTRFPGKPLASIGGRSMLSHVVDIARNAAALRPGTRIAVATDDNRIADTARELGVDCALTSPECRTGSDRVHEALRNLKWDVDIVMGLQGDAPFTPSVAVNELLAGFDRHADADVMTPIVRLRWDELDTLRANKKTTPFSGTTAIIDARGRALWFSKQIIPAIRKEDRTQPLSPVHQHLGLYAFRVPALARFVTLPESPYETCEGLEQLRMLENGMNVYTAVLDVDPGTVQAGVDTPEDLERANDLWNARHA